MDDATTTTPETTIGIDLGDRTSHICVLDAGREVQESGTVAMTQVAMRPRFERCERARVAIEAGTQSAWAYELLTGLGGVRAVQEQGMPSPLFEER